MNLKARNDPTPLFATHSPFFLVLRGSPFAAIGLFLMFIRSIYDGTFNQSGSGDVIINGDVASNANCNVNIGNNNIANSGQVNVNGVDVDQTCSVINGNNNNNTGQISINGGLQAQAACTSITGNPAFIALLVLLVLFALLFLGTFLLWIRERRLRKRNEATIEEGLEENSPALATIERRPTGSTVSPFMERGVGLDLGAPRQRQASKEQIRPREMGISADPPPGYPD
ncbi:hypothetical protein MVEN_00729400 [Mycena venus]|uniref:Uncharacterized protein n=1 Tax=Mycena venus TaxID=2733690 RepID=A0A8H6YF49_9AGAR|nr:hypothetical protein MVEN_00729400 [Mycena venus]